MKAHTLFFLSLVTTAPAHAVHHGSPSNDDSVVTFFGEGGGGASGVMISPDVVLTVDHVIRGDGYASVKFTNVGDARDISKIPESRIGRFKEGRTLSQRAIFTMPGGPPRPGSESVTLLLVADADRKKFKDVKFPKLPKPGQKPPERLRIVGYGEPARGLRQEGGVVNGFAYPQAPYLYETQRGLANQLTAGGDSGGALRDDEYLYGLHLLVLMSPPDAPYLPPSERYYAGTAFFIAETKFREEIDRVMREWKLIK